MTLQRLNDPPPMPSHVDQPTRRHVVGWLGGLLASAGLAPASGFAAVPGAAFATAWVEAHNGRARLLAARVGAVPYAALEIALADGWKTYWRTPGDAGGVPPAFDWAGSTNLARAHVLYPAPSRLHDKAGDTIGYKGGVLIPIRLEPRDPAAAIKLALALEYGICREICIPAEASFDLSLAPGGADAAGKGSPEASSQISAALTRIPRPAERRAETDPRLVSARLDRKGEAAEIRIEAEAPAGAVASLDVFAAAPDGVFVSQPRKTGAPQGNRQQFTIAVAGRSELAELLGKLLRLTLVAATGSCEAGWTVA